MGGCVVPDTKTVTSIELAQTIYRGFYGENIDVETLPIRDALVYRMAAVEILKRYHVTPS
jgi:hypothetical protein